MRTQCKAGPPLVRECEEERLTQYGDVGPSSYTKLGRDKKVELKAISCDTICILER